MKDLNKLVGYLVELQNIQKRDKEVTKLFQEGRTQEALKMKRSVVDESYSLFGSFAASYVPIDASEADTFEYLQGQSDSIRRRHNTVLFDFESGQLSNDELALQNKYLNKKSERFSKSHQDL